MEILLGSLDGDGPYPFPNDQYLGEVLAADSISGPELAAAIGLTAGFPINDTAGWLKFKSHEGITFLVAKRTLRYRLSWNQLNAAMAVNSGRLITFKGSTYKLRLLRGAEKDPTDWVAGLGQDNPVIAKPSEWNRFIHRVAAGNPGQAPSWASFPLSELNIAVSSTGRMTICQEALGSDATMSVARGNASLTQFNYVYKADGSASSTQNHYGWRPVLEYVGEAVVYPGSGPGSKSLAFGDENIGYFGEVSAAEMMTHLELRNAIGASWPSMRTDSGWFKFFHKGVVKFISKNTLATGLTWNQVYGAGVMYGTDDFGKYPVAPGVNQRKVIQWARESKTWTFVPHLITGCATDPNTTGVAPQPDTEWYDLMFRVFTGTQPNAGTFAQYAAADVAMHVAHTVPETAGSNTAYHLIRGNGAPAAVTAWNQKDNATAYSQHIRLTLNVQGDPREEPPTAGPAFWLDPSDQPNGSTTIVDKSRKAVAVNNSGVVVSSEGPRPGVKSMFFDKSSVKYLRMSGALMPNVLAKDFQIDYWFKPDGTPAGTMGVITQWAQSANNAGFLALVGSSGADAYLFGPYNSNSAMITAPANANHLNWVKRSIRRKGSVFEYWQDDVMVGTFTSALSATKTVDWIIGSYMNSSNVIPATGIVPMGGWLADVRVYDFYKGNGSDGGYPYDEYLGEVATADFITPSALTTAVGITEGAPQDDGFGWLQFRIDGKILMVGKRSIRYNISWNHINSKGCVDGTKTVTYGGKTYKVRLLKGAEANPSAWTTAMGQDNPLILAASEWNRLIHRVSVNNPGPASNWEMFTDEQLNVRDGSGSRTLCQETIAENGYAVGRGFSSLRWFNYQLKSDGPDNSNFVNFGWRPVLELVE